MWQAIGRLGEDGCSRTRAMFSGYMDSRLNPEELARVERHLHTCEACREHFESLRATVTMLQSLPEATTSRSFTVAPIAPVLSRRPLQALRFATVGVALLLVLAFAADWTDLFRHNPFSEPRLGISSLDIGGAESTEEDESYWVVSGVRNDINANSQTQVDLVVPDNSDNVDVALQFLSEANDGVLYGSMVDDAEDVPHLALAEGEGVAAGGEAEKYAVVTATEVEPGPFATNGTKTMSAIDSIIRGQDGTYLNLVNAASDNSVLYSFNLEEAKREIAPATGRDWLRPLEYGLIGVVVVLGGATLVLRLRQRRRKAREAG